MPAHSSSQVTDDMQALTLDAYLQRHGFHLIPPHSEKNEGFITEGQKRQFTEVLETYSPITSVIEIGLNAGHSADHILKTCPQIQKFVSIDINIHPYSTLAIEYFSKKYAGAFQFIQGDSHVIVPDYATHFPKQKFDLIYIDGSHTYEGSFGDIQNCEKLAHPDTILWIDDYHLLGSGQAILGAQIEGLIEVIAYHESSDLFGPRYWAEARYCSK